MPYKKATVMFGERLVDTKTYQKTGNEEEKPPSLRTCTMSSQATTWHLLTVIQTTTVQGPTLYLMIIWCAMVPTHETTRLTS